MLMLFILINAVNVSYLSKTYLPCVARLRTLVSDLSFTINQFLVLMDGLYPNFLKIDFNQDFTEPSAI